MCCRNERPLMLLLYTFHRVTQWVCTVHSITSILFKLGYCAHMCRFNVTTYHWCQGLYWMWWCLFVPSSLLFPPWRMFCLPTFSYSDSFPLQGDTHPTSFLLRSSTTNISSSSPSSSHSALSPPLHHLYRVLHKPFIFSCQPPILHHDQTRSFISGTKKRCVRDCALCETMIGGIVRKVWWQLEVKRAITRNPTTSLMTALSRVHCIRATAPPWALLGASFSLAISAAECTTADLAHLLVVWVQSGLLAPHQSPHKPPKCPTHPPLPYSHSSSPLSTASEIDLFELEINPSIFQPLKQVTNKQFFYAAERWVRQPALWMFRCDFAFVLLHYILAPIICACPLLSRNIFNNTLDIATSQVGFVSKNDK